MSVPSYRDIEQALRLFRDGRSLIMKVLLDHIACANVCAEPFVALSRFFCRLKSADSIVEKLDRKKIEIKDASEIPDRIPDVLGFRIIVANNRELTAMDEFMKSRFEVVGRHARTTEPGEFGERGIEYSAIYHGDNMNCPFELQLRTFLQHYWASQSFHLFHKQPRERALLQKELLLQFGNALAQAETYANELASGRAFALPKPTCLPELGSFRDRLHLIVIEPGEQFADHVIQPLSDRVKEDHEAIVAQKMDLYRAFPHAAIVECSCLNFLAFHLNEPLVQIPLERMARTRM